ncbi:peptide/nickel transport system permease protein [Symbiobacterium terraclitae]|uniref:Peptide/nickel transport system permease protein n=1 Tax=Symbiobacterium terraclitae TaxID=557451 RepID=A0ABS4JVU0_9FIRM|nr:oligopeptide ABC transporter permease [Symbiobacterium terraclitae]MBP2019667.1 peptide/nickel transport system permease protein [Symbiobacterium terraclitae]
MTLGARGTLSERAVRRPSARTRPSGRFSRAVLDPETAPYGGAWRRFRANRRAMLGLCILIVLVLASAFAPQLTWHDRDLPDVRAAEQPPSRTHWLGTDELGRDIYTRLLYGGRISLTVGLVAVAIYTAIGVVLGAVAGYYGGVVDGVIMRITDVVMVVPFFPLALTMAAALRPSVYNTMIVIGLLGWTGICRLVRGEFLTLRSREYVAAARAVGARDARIIFRHILPNALAPIVVAATLGVGTAILSEAGLSFLGFGVQQPTPSWGNMLSAAISLKVLLLQPWIWLPPGLMIFIAVLAINLVGEGLRDALDPRLTR